MMNIRKAAAMAAFVLLCTNAIAQSVSKPVADAFNAHKFHMKLSGVQATQGVSMTMTTDIASKGEVTMSRVDMSGYKVVTLSSGGANFMLDEAKKTFMAMPGGGAQPMPKGSLEFVRHGKCTLNGSEYQFDEYKGADGTVLSCYYNSNKVSAIEIVQGKEKFGPMNLISFSSAIPANMYFCLGPEWKGSSPVAPPRCASPWHDTEPVVELACGSGSGRINVSGKVEASTENLTSADTEKPKEYTIAGVELAIDELGKEMAGMSDEEMKEYILVGASEASIDVQSGCVTAKTVERAIARCVICPHSVTYLNAGAAVHELSGPEKAIPFFESAETLSPGNPVVATSLFDCYIELGNLAKAESVVRTATTRTPDGSVLWQQLASLCFRKENYRESARALFKSMSLGYFDDISAALCLSLFYHVTSQMTQDPVGYNFYDGMREIFTEENLAYLEKAASCGHEDIVPGTPKEFRTDWNLIYGNLEYAHEALDEMSEGYSKQMKQLTKNAENILKESFGEIYLMMGQNPMLYTVLCNEKKGNDESKLLYLCDSREFWANYMIMLYYQSMTSWLRGPQGKFPIPARESADKALKQVETVANNTLHQYSKESSAECDAVKGKDGVEIFLKIYQIELNYSRLEYNTIKAEKNNVLSIEAKYWNKEVAPVLSEYYNRASLTAQYISDQRLQLYFLYQMMATMYSAKADMMMTGSSLGSAMDNAAERVEMLEKSIAEIKGAVWKSERDAFKEHKRELQLMDAYVLHDFDEKEKNDGGLEVIMGTSPMCGSELHFRFGSDGFSVECVDKVTGHTTTWGSNGFYTRTNYLLEYDAKQAALHKAAFDKKQRAETIKAVANAVLGKIPVVGQIVGAYSNIEKVDKFKESGNTESARESVVTFDSNGHMLQGRGRTTRTEMAGGNITHIKTTSFINGRRSRRDYLGINADGPVGTGFSIGAYVETTGMK